MKRGYKFNLCEYIRYFILGIIVAALASGSPAINATHSDTQPCELFITGECPNKMKPYEKDIPACPKIVNPCPLEQSEQGITQ